MNELYFDNDKDFGFVEVEGSEKEVFGDELEEGILNPCMNLIFLFDTSASMGFKGGVRINQVNYAMPDVLKAVRDFTTEESEIPIDLKVRIAAFNDNAYWVMGNTDDGVDISEACENWNDLTAQGTTNTAGAIDLILPALTVQRMGKKNYHPIVILVTDGDSNDRSATQAAIERLRNAMTAHGNLDKVWRVAIGVEDYNEAELLDFAMRGTVENDFGDEQHNVPMVFKVDNAQKLAKVLKNVTVSTLSSSIGAGTAGGDKGIVVPDDIIDI